MQYRRSVRSARHGAVWPTAILLTVIALVGAASPARADLIIQAAPAPQRSTATSASVATSSDADDESTTSGGTFSSTIASSAGNTGGSANADASQDSIIPNLTGDGIDGLGFAGGSLSLVQAVGGGFNADSFFDVFFEVDVAEVYDITASVGFSGSAGVTGLASVLLVDETNADTLVELLQDQDTPGFDVASTQILLLPGITYRLTAQATAGIEISGPGSVEASGFWFVSVLGESAIVPEPSGLVLALIGTAGLAVVARRRARRA